MGVCNPKSTIKKIETFAAADPPMELVSGCRLDNIHKYYNLIRVIGYGQFGTVREATKILDSTNPITQAEPIRYAIKSISKEKAKGELKFLKRELEILQIVDHPNVIKMFEVFEDTQFIHIVMELCTGGDLFDHLIEKQCLNEQEVSNFIRKIILGTKHLHSLKICHRDLKPENFMLTDKSPNAELKIIDFGMSTQYGLNEMKTVAGTPYFLAPEVYSKKYGKECDYWSIGVIMYFLLSGKYPFEGKSLADVLIKTRRGEYNFMDVKWNNISDDAKDLISKLLVVDPEKRINLKQALNHKWFRSACGQRENSMCLDVLHSIINYKAQGKLWKETMKIFAKMLTEDQIKDLRDAFCRIDTDKNGFITAADIREGMKSQNYQMAAGKFQKLIESIDYIGQGRLNYEQFIIAALDKKQFINEENMWNIFKLFDHDNDGNIRINELKRILGEAGCCVSEGEYCELINEFKLKAGDEMSFEKFKDIMTCFSPEATPELGPPCIEEDESREARVSMRRLSQKRFSVRRSTNSSSEIRKPSESDIKNLG